MPATPVIGVTADVLAGATVDIEATSGETWAITLVAANSMTATFEVYLVVTDGTNSAPLFKLHNAAFDRYAGHMGGTSLILYRPASGARTLLRVKNTSAGTVKFSYTGIKLAGLTLTAHVGSIAHGATATITPSAGECWAVKYGAMGSDAITPTASADADIRLRDTSSGLEGLVRGETTSDSSSAFDPDPVTDAAAPLAAQVRGALFNAHDGLEVKFANNTGGGLYYGLLAVKLSETPVGDVYNIGLSSITDITPAADELWCITGVVADFATSGMADWSVIIGGTAYSIKNQDAGSVKLQRREARKLFVNSDNPLRLSWGGSGTGGYVGYSGFKMP